MFIRPLARSIRATVSVSKHYAAATIVAIGHQGGVAGFVANAFFDPKTHLGFVELHNATNPGYSDDLPLEMLMAVAH